MDHAYITVHNVLSAEPSRRHALRKYVNGHGGLRSEFIKSLEKDILEMNGKEIVKAMDDFIKRKGITIVSEKPSVRLDEENGWYRVDVAYTIEV